MPRAGSPGHAPTPEPPPMTRRHLRVHARVGDMPQGVKAREIRHVATVKVRMEWGGANPLRDGPTGSRSRTPHSPSPFLSALYQPVPSLIRDSRDRRPSAGPGRARKPPQCVDRTRGLFHARTRSPSSPVEPLDPLPGTTTPPGSRSPQRGGKARGWRPSPARRCGGRPGAGPPGRPGAPGTAGRGNNGGGPPVLSGERCGSPAPRSLDPLIREAAHPGHLVSTIRTYRSGMGSIGCSGATRASTPCRCRM